MSDHERDPEQNDNHPDRKSSSRPVDEDDHARDDETTSSDRSTDITTQNPGEDKSLASSGEVAESHAPEVIEELAPLGLRLSEVQRLQDRWGIEGTAKQLVSDSSGTSASESGDHLK